MKFQNSSVSFSVLALSAEYKAVLNALVNVPPNIAMRPVTSATSRWDNEQIGRSCTSSLGVPMIVGYP